jgi:hypothetical protein
MHDSQIEEQLRGVLRAEGDGIPLTITAAELERRLAARRSATGGRRLSMVAAAVAAVVVLSMVAAGNGWLKLPAIGTVPSPSASAAATPPSSAVPSFEPVAGVPRIEPSEGSTVLTEVLPSTFAGASDGAFDADLPLDQYIVTVDVLCVGTSLTLSEGSREWPVSCNAEPTGEGTQTGFVIPVVDGHLALRWTVDAGVGYTILVTTSVLPTSLPALEPVDGTPVIDEASPSDQPIPDGTGTLVTRSLGSIPDAAEYSISIVCLGPGQLAYSIGQPGRNDHLASSSTVCDGKTQPEGFTHDAEAGSQHEVFITTDSRTAWHVMIGVVVPGPGPGPSASSEPTAARSPLGRPDEAILVRPIGASWTTPDSLEVTRFDPADQSSDVIATIPGSVVPAGKWISTDAKPVVSATGWLAIPIRPGPDATDTEAAVVFVDLLDLTAAPKSIVGPQSGSWNGDTFAANSPDGVQIYDPATGSLGTAPVTDPAVQIATIGNNDFDPVWTTAPNSRFVARRDMGEWGVVSVDGSFSVTTDLPPIYQRTGRERPTGADAHSFVPACTGSGNDPLEAGCTMVETDAKGMPISTRVGRADYVSLADFAWAANGRDAWLLLDDGVAGGGGGSGDGIAWLYLSEPDGTRTERARLQLGGRDFAILGVGESLGGRPIVAIGSRNSWLRALVTTSGSEFAAPAPGSSTVLEGTAWFAGWAGPQLDYDPD